VRRALSATNSFVNRRDRASGRPGNALVLSFIADLQTCYSKGLNCRIISFIFSYETRMQRYGQAAGQFISVTAYFMIVGGG
jgi:hypothetical protein